MSSSRFSAVKRLLEDENTSAAVVYLSALSVFGNDLQEFEQETLRLECRRLGIAVPPQNWEELFAALALRGDGRFMADAGTFENTIIAFNGGMADVHGLEPVIPAHIAWGVQVAQIITANLLDDELVEYLDYEPVSYAAVMCKAHGMVCVPPSLAFCAERLRELTPNSLELCSDVKKAWVAWHEPYALHHELREDPIGVQLALMFAVEAYVSERADAQTKQLLRLRAA